MELVGGGELFDVIVRNKSLTEMEASDLSDGGVFFGAQELHGTPNGGRVASTWLYCHDKCMEDKMAGYFWQTSLRCPLAEVSWKLLKVVVSMFQKFCIFCGEVFFLCFQIRKNIIASCLFRVHFS